MIGRRQSADPVLGRPLPRRRKRRRGRLVVGVALAVAALVAWRMDGAPVERAEPTVNEPAPQAVPNDRLLVLRAPEIRAFGAPMEVDGEADFDAAIVATPTFPTYVEGAIEAGQGLTVAIAARGVPSTSLNRVVASLGEIVDFRRSQVGDRFEVELTSDGVVTSLRYQSSPEVVYEARLIGDDEYESRRVEVPLDVELHTVVGSVSSSFYASVVAAGEAEALAREVVMIFQWDLDFSRDVRPGDAFRIHFEKVFLEGEFLRYGRVLAAEYAGSRVAHAAYYFDDPDHAGYYSADGVPLERMFLAAPCRYRRISSRFDLNRMHPVMNRRVPHLGVDYAADTGTPVWASADGVVTHAAYDRRGGNLIKIRHADGYESIYAHLHRFAPGLERGDTVEQGQHIGDVGTTGMSTGPHLHYGLKYRGDYVDPLGREWARGAALRGRALSDFRRRQSQLVATMEARPMPEVHASAEGSAEPEPEEDPLDMFMHGLDYGY